MDLKRQFNLSGKFMREQPVLFTLHSSLSPLKPLLLIALKIIYLLSKKLFVHLCNILVLIDSEQMNEDRTRVMKAVVSQNIMIRKLVENSIFNLHPIPLELFFQSRAIYLEHCFGVVDSSGSIQYYSNLIENATLQYKK